MTGSDEDGDTKIPNLFARLQQQESLDRSPRDRAYLMVLAGPNIGQMYQIEEGETFIGRGQYATIRLNDDGISRRHARLDQQGGAVVIQDLKSSNGTLLNGTVVAGEQLHALRDGDRIRLGANTLLQFTYYDDHQAAAPLTKPLGLDRSDETTASFRVPVDMLTATPPGSRELTPRPRPAAPAGLAKTPPMGLRLSSPQKPPLPRRMSKPIDVFVSYAPEDEALRRELDRHLASLQRSGEIRAFYASQIGAGASFQAAMDAGIEAARLFLLLVSADFLASDACDVEVTRALSRHWAGEPSVIPIILRDCDWKTAPFAHLKVLPQQSKAVTSASNRDEAWAEVVAGIRAEIQRFEARPFPSYPDAATQLLSEQIEGAYARRRALQEHGIDTAAVDREILDMRRQLREGGQLRAGDSLGNGRYLLLRQVGRGGFAIVWEALDRERLDRVAVKVLHSNLAGDRIRLERFFRGARTMAELGHESVVRVLEKHGEDGGYHYFVMEFIAGDDLRQAVLKKTLSGEAVLPVILRVGEALASAHRKGLVHRDVKPANILLDAAGTPRLTDFDLVGAADSTGGTRTGALGTVVYTAPEITDRPQDADGRADVYSLAMTMVFGLHGAELSLLTVRNVDQLIDRMSCKDAIKVVLKRALDWDKQARFEDAGAFCDALRRATAT
jgi:pSer/pThr/pTyr-binding forkhead associated (FHA) protein